MSHAIMGPPRGRELGVVRLASQFAPGTASPTDVPGMSITVTVGTRAIYVTTYSPLHKNNTLQQSSVLSILEGSTTIISAYSTAPVANQGAVAFAMERLTPTPGQHTYKLQTSAIGGIPTLTAPTFLIVTEA